MWGAAKESADDHVATEGNVDFHFPFAVRIRRNQLDPAPRQRAGSFIIQEFLEEKIIPTLPHSSFSPDLAPYDLSLILKMKLHLRRTHHGDVQNVKEAVTVVLNWLNSGLPRVLPIARAKLESLWTVIVRLLWRSIMKFFS